MQKFRLNVWRNNLIAKYFHSYWVTKKEKTMTPKGMSLVLTYEESPSEYYFMLSNHFLTMFEIYNDKSYYLKKAMKRWYE